MDLFNILQESKNILEQEAFFEKAKLSKNDSKLKYDIWIDSATVSHWGDELYTACHDVNKIKSKNKYPKEKFILQHLWGCWEDYYLNRIDNYIDDVEIKENKNNNSKNI